MGLEVVNFLMLALVHLGAALDKSEGEKRREECGARERRESNKEPSEIKRAKGIDR